MLLLQRRDGETVHIGENIVVTVQAIQGKRVTLGFEAPREVVILRGELSPGEAVAPLLRAPAEQGRMADASKYLPEIAEALDDPTLTSVSQVATGIRDLRARLADQGGRVDKASLVAWVESVGIDVRDDHDDEIVSLAFFEGARQQAVVAQNVQAAPIPMVLHCPSCGMQHIDAPDAPDMVSVHLDGHESRWDNPPHRSHFCHGCGTIWRPADVPTVGVAAIQTRGKADRIVHAERARVPDGLDSILEVVNVSIAGLDEEMLRLSTKLSRTRKPYNKGPTRDDLAYTKDKYADAIAARNKLEAMLAAAPSQPETAQP